MGPSARVLGALVGLLLLTFGLRVAGLELQSIWVDEGFSVDFSSRTAADMTAMWKARGGASAISDPQAAQAATDPLAIAVDIHPPLYYLLLHEWLPVVGRGEYAVRFPSVMVGVLLVLALYKLGASLGSRAVGLSAAGVGAVAPFYVAYSQEARMYAPVALFGAFSLYFTWLAIRRPRAIWPWVGLVASSSLALYMHYSAVLVIGAENVIVAAVLVWRLLRPRALLIRWAAAQLALLAVFFPWLRTTIGQVAKYNENLWVPNWQHELTETFRAFDAGLWLPPRESLLLALPVTAVFLLGIGAAIFRGGGRRAQHMRGAMPVMAGGSAALPRVANLRPALLLGGGTLVVETLLALAAFQVRPEFHPRYLMVLATPYYLLLGLALAALWQRWRLAGALAGAGLAAVFAVGLLGYEFDPNFAKDDTRTLAQYLASRTTPEDVIVLDAPEPLGYYYHGPAKLFYIAGDEATAGPQMTDKLTGKQRAVFVQWFLSTSDPEQLLPFLLQKYGRLVDDHTFRGYRERTYALPADTRLELTAPDKPARANFANIFELDGAGYSPALAGDSQLAAKINEPLAVSGHSLMLSLRWRLLQPVAKDYKVTAYLSDQAGHLAGQADLLLRHGQAATSRWRAGEEAIAYYVLPTLSGLMPGRYNVNLAVYPEGEVERLSVLDAAGAPGGGNVAIGAIDVLPPAEPAGSLELANNVNQPVAPGVSLIGFDLPPATAVQGDSLHITLGWKATAQPADGLKTTLALLRDGSSRPAWQTSAAPRFPTGRWHAGDVFRDWYDPVLPPQLEPGAYQLLAGIGGDLVPLGPVEVRERKRSFATPTPQHAAGGNLGGAVELLGYDQDKPAYAPGSTARVTVYWRAVSAMSDSYTAFVHILDPGRHVVAQVDAIPGQSRLPTTGWLPGEVVQDVYELPLKPSLPAGAYQLEVGFYRGDTGVRLKATSSDVPAIDDGLLIGELTVTK